ncbi:MAG: spore coat protein CotH [Ruminococcaceae bacterium]|nr:spore coat protein CotH [Oscillospiraceae bacterium]
MSTHKHIDKICLVAAVLALVLCAVFMNGEALGIQAASKVMGYENRLFDTSKVHTIDIVIDDWEGFLETARSEEYSVCSVVIDGEAVTNVGIRGKGNTSLSNVASMDSDRYSFKIEFDQYDSTKTYHGLDKLSLNNVIQDNTYMKDYLSYQMMGEFGVPAPLCSYAYITVNGEDWGLYLAVEAVEESFLQRNYGKDYGELYKPDSMNMGGGRGNGKDFEMPDFSEQQASSNKNTLQSEGNNRGGMPMPGTMPGGFGRGGFSLDKETIRKAFEDLELDTSILDGIDFDNITTDTIQTVLAGLDEKTMQSLMKVVMDSGEMQMPDMGGGFGMGSSQTKLQYIDDNPASYSTIFESAKTNVTDADQSRLIASLKQLSENENLEQVVNIEDVLRYFVVHNYVVNGDSYTGNMIHNYYLYEEDGRLSMIPWDYNLAFGTFQGNNAASAVNDNIDEVLSDRPMQAWIFSDETYSQQYYALYTELLEKVDVQGIIDHAYDLIAPYVEKDPSAFCTYEEFQTGVETLKEFCALRTESIQLQLAGSTETVDAGALNLSDMGTMGGGMGGFGGRGNREDFAGKDFGSADSSDGAFAPNVTPQFGNQNAAVPGGAEMPDNMEVPEGTQLPGGIEIPEGTQPGATEMPEGLQIPSGMERPGGMQRPGGQTDKMSGNQNSSGNMPSAESFPMPGQGGGKFQFPDRMNADVSAASSQTTVTLLVVSAVVLLVGLIIAKKYRH